MTVTIGGPAALQVSPIALGALSLGSAVDERTSYAVLDRFRELGGTFVDTADNYVFWDGGSGDESETTLGRWMAERGVRDEIVLATKVGARPRTPGSGLEDAEGLSGRAIRAALEGSLRRLQTDRVDLLYAHIEDRSVPLAETVGTFGALVADGSARVLGVSNHPAWRIERARAVATVSGVPRYTVVQQRYSYVQARPGRSLQAAGHVHASEELLDYVAAEPDLTLVAYSSLLSGAYTRSDKTLPPAYDHPGVAARLTALREVAADVGATPNQVVLAWLIGRGIVPVVGVTRVEQLEEVMAAQDLRLDADATKRLDEAD
jgi:aryl-alcohol dehydrogenase-like predicted oxidoreductase